MSRPALALGASGGAAYPERMLERAGVLDRLWHDMRGRIGRRSGLPRGRANDVVARVRRFDSVVRRLDDRALRAQARATGRRLRVSGFDPAVVAEAFALVRECAGRTIGMRHFDVQLMGGWIMLDGAIAEMQTGEGKTLTATLTAATAALAGYGVHVVTVNDYLAERDAESMAPVYERLGLSVGVVVSGLSEEEKRRAYASDVVYCSNKELAFDFLRDRIRIGPRETRLGLRVHDLARRGRIRDGLLLRGLYFAIVDEADSVLVDEARTPLIISRTTGDAAATRLYHEAIELAGGLTAETDFQRVPRERRVTLTPQGRERLEASGAALGGLWAGPRRREELVTQALTALHLYQRDVHYIVREGAVHIVDEYTGRVLEGRSWEQGLHQMIEVKEGLELSGRKETLARTTYQRFFRRYLRLAGMTGTGSELAGELWSVYALNVVAVPTHRPSRRRMLPTRVFGTEDAKWAHVCARVRVTVAGGQPVLVGTRSVADSERLSDRLAAADVPHRVLNARQDAEEAGIVAGAGASGVVTVATNMAGRGTDIGIDAAAAAAGGLHVIATALHDSRRIDRQLFGRCARQGDPGSVEVVLSLEDGLVTTFGGARLARVLRPWLDTGFGQWCAWRHLRRLQQRAERHNAAVRRDLVRNDEKLEESLAFSGRNLA